MPVADTIVAISTPPGRGGIGIVRLSGPDAASYAVQLVHLHRPLEHARARLADVLAPESLIGSDSDLPTNHDDPARIAEARIDEALVTWFASPNSYTGDDLVEIAAHGSPIVLNTILQSALRLGARLAEPGEFTQRAFLSGRLDLTQAEAVRDLIEAQTLAQARLAAMQMGGALSRRVMPIKNALLELIALLEAGIDFAEDDLSVAPDSEIATRISAVRAPLAALEKTFAHGRVLHDGLTLAIVGRPNAGKSSLFNALIERDRAIVTAQPGTTRDTVTERIALGGIPLELVDTAGLREAHDEAERLGIARSREALADAAIVLIVLDGAELTQPHIVQGLHEDDRALMTSLAGRPALIALNKSDLISEPATSALAVSDLAGPDLVVSGLAEPDLVVSDLVEPGLSELDPRPLGPTNNNSLTQFGLPVLTTSAITGSGIPELRAAIVSLATGGAAAEPGMLTSTRHHQAIQTAISGLDDATAALASAIPHEMILLDLYRTLWALDGLTGQTTPDDILNLIFSTFCIGK